MTPAKILIVEDSRVVAMDLKLQLTRIGHTVVAMTARGEDALQLAREKQPGLVLMDIRLEGNVDGVEAAQQIREHCNIPVVFLTAYADDRTVERASATEPFGYLLKPFEDSQLRTVIEMALYKHAAERRLRESERRFVTTLSSIGDAVIATDSQTRVTFMNPVAEALTGWVQPQAVGRPLKEVFRIVNEETRQPVEDPASKVLRLGTVVGLANHTILQARDGRELPIDDSGAPIVDDLGAVTGVVLVFRDISERRRMEEVLRTAQTDLVRAARTTSMNELAASIADEVNQPLAAMVANADACVLWLEKDPPDLENARSAAQRVSRDGHHAGDAIRSIRALMRKPSSEMKPIDINDVVRDVLELVRGDLQRHDVSLEARLSAHPIPVLGDRIQLQQVVVNLVTNGIEAMKGVKRRRRILRVGTNLDESGAALTAVEDTGTGLDESTAERIFDPLFNTKLEGIAAGTGLGLGLGFGLSICRTIVQAHGGRLWAAPRKPHGTVFQFSLPRLKDVL